MSSSKRLATNIGSSAPSFVQTVLNLVSGQRLILLVLMTGEIQWDNAGGFGNNKFGECVEKWL